MTKMEIGRILSGIAAVVLLLLFAVSADTQTERAFTTDNGLASDSITCMIEAQDGDLWIGTDNGLSQFDGFFQGGGLEGKYVYSLFQLSSGDIWAAVANCYLEGPMHGLQSSLYVRSGEEEPWQAKHWLSSWNIAICPVLESSDGKVWAVDLFDHYNQVLNCMGYRDREFDIWNGLYSYDGTEWTPHLECMNVNALLELPGNVLWAGTDSGLYSYSNAAWQEHEELKRKIVYALIKSSDGMIWAGTDDGLYSYSGTEWRRDGRLGGKVVYSLLQSSDGTIWVGTNDGLCSLNGITWHAALDGMAIRSLLEPSDNTIWVRTDDSAYSYGASGWTQHWIGSTVRSLLSSSDGTVWGATRSHGLQSYNAGIWHEQERQSAAGVSVLFESSDGTVWTATNEGLRSWDGTNWARHELPDGISAKDLLETSDGTMVVGTNDGIFYYEGGVWKRAIHLNNHFPTEFLFESADGRIWAGTTDGYLAVADDLTPSPPSDPEDIFSGPYFALMWPCGDPLDGYSCNLELGLEASDGVIWVAATIEGYGTGSDSVLYNYDAAANEWTMSGFMQHVCSLFESSDGSIWISAVYDDPHRDWQYSEASESDGLYSYDGAGWRHHKWLSREDTLNATFVESSDGKIWVGTGSGLYSYDGMIWKSHLSGMSIRSLYEASDSSIWVGTEASGLQIYDGIRWYRRTTADGLPVTRLLEDSSGNWWMVTQNGVARYKPQANENPPVIRIVEPKNQDITIGSAAIFVQWTAGDKETETHLLTYEYKLNDNSWEKTGLDFVTLTGLSEGSNLFQIRAVDSDFNRSQKAELRINVDTDPPNVLITTPADGDIVGAMLRIIGGVIDSDLQEFWVEYALGDKPSDSDFRLINKADHTVASGLLAEWDASSQPEGLYTIRLSALDGLDHHRDYSITVTLDKTPPTAKLISPQADSHLAKQTEIVGEAEDQYLESYILEYADLNIDTVIWRQIHTESGLTQDQKRKVEFQHDWEVPTGVREILIRLRAFDAAGNADNNNQIISVKVQQILTKERGGEVLSPDGNAILHIPPRSLGSDEIVAINRVSENEIETPADSIRSLNLAYDIKPAGLKFRSIKPATLQIGLDDTLTQRHRRIAVFRLNKVDDTSGWVFLGGTIRGDKITMGITQAGQYALMEMETDAADLSEIGSLFTCQPRVFSPEAGQTTTISFSLQEEASVTLKVYNIDGRLQKTLVSGSMYAGRNAVLWDGGNEDGEIVPSGLYIITLESEEERVETKAVIVKNR